MKNLSDFAYTLQKAHADSQTCKALCSACYTCHMTQSVARATSSVYVDLNVAQLSHY